MQPDGKIPTNYRESSRWLKCRNDGIYDIEPYAPMTIVASGPPDGEKFRDHIFKVLPMYTWKGKEEAKKLNLPEYDNYTFPYLPVLHMALNGPTKIPGTLSAPEARNRYGLCTIDYPAKAIITEVGYNSSLDWPMWPDLSTDTLTVYRFSSDWNGGDIWRSRNVNGRTGYAGRPPYDRRVVKALAYDLDPNGKTTNKDDVVAWVIDMSEDPNSNIAIQAPLSPIAAMDVNGFIPIGPIEGGTYYGRLYGRDISNPNNPVLTIRQGGLYVVTVRVILKGLVDGSIFPRTEVFIHLDVESTDIGHGTWSLSFVLPTNITSSKRVIRETISPAITGIDISGGYENPKLSQLVSYRTVEATAYIRVEQLEVPDAGANNADLCKIKVRYEASPYVGLDFGSLIQIDNIYVGSRPGDTEEDQGAS
ncbi:MAG: hypothetical protein NXI32_09280 [bacterium]|nr:hypothetical protein [bacterium]